MYTGSVPAFLLQEVAQSITASRRQAKRIRESFFIENKPTFM
jgi:hypothetical protein